MTAYDDIADGDPQVELASFVWTVFDDLDWVAGSNQILAPETDAFPQDQLYAFAANFAEAWPGVGDGRDELMEAILSLGFAQLEAIGLTGVQLRTKLIPWSIARGQLSETIDSAGEEELDRYGPDPQGPVKRAGKLRRFANYLHIGRICKWTSRTLEHADTVLESLFKVLPVGDKVTEIKKTIEKTTRQLAEELDD